MTKGDISGGGYPGTIVARSELGHADAALVTEAERAAARARPLFSNFAVGAAVRTEGGADPYLGWNVEDPSLVRVLHAEQAAIYAAVHRENEAARVLDIAIWGTGDVPPCGACRQTIVDSNAAARVLFPYRGGILITSAADLLPLSFRITPATS
jgi:cytidine deaminase